MINMRGLALIAGIWTVAPNVAWAAERFERIGAVVDNYFNESPVTADAVVTGFVRYATNVSAGPRTTEVLADVPADWAGSEICIKVTTNDGLYSGRGRFASPAKWAASDIAAFAYETDTREIFEYSQSDIAVVAKPGNCDEPLTSLTIASWGAASSELEPLGYLLLNSFRADAVFLLIGESEVDCEPIMKGPRASFDFRCPIDIELISGGAEAQIYRLRGQSADPPLLIKLSAY